MEKQGILEEFMELVAIDVESRDERQIADVLIRKLEALGFEVYEDGTGEKIGGNTGNLIAVLPGTLEGSVLFSSHMDRVANGKGIKPVIHDGLITSDGTTILAADDISGVAAILDGVRRLKASGRPLPRIEVAFSVCEEKGVTGSKYFEFDRFKSKLGFVFDSPGRLGRINNQAPSACEFKIRVHGRPAHAGNEPEKGVDALKIASKILVTLRTGRLDEETTSNFPIIKTGNTATNVVCDSVEITGEARSRTHQKLLDYVAYVEKHCRELVADTEGSCEVEVIHKYQGFRIEKDAESISIIEEALGQMGMEATVTPGGGGMDANRFNLKGIESVGVATGYSKNHTLQEQIVLDDLLRSGELVEKIVEVYSSRL